MAKGHTAELKERIEAYVRDQLFPFRAGSVHLEVEGVEALCRVLNRSLDSFAEQIHSGPAKWLPTVNLVLVDDALVFGVDWDKPQSRELGLFRCDVVDEQNELISRADAERMIAEFKGCVVGVRFDVRLPSVGLCTRLRLEGNDVVARVELTPDGEDLVTQDYQLAFSGMCGGPGPVNGGPRVLEGIELLGVDLHDHKVGYSSGGTSAPQ